ncbi:MAG: rRNA adenine N(6)-methyltransferase family protein [Candidatus Saccharibacteria bacterium]|nr:rRNA adenine N(6)-methyltransferase family protein [Candidatus Saccharibacteria bacterium]
MKRLHNYSQHFLVNPRLVYELIGHSNLRKNDTVLEIGAGSGVITMALAKRVRRVVAVEAEQKTAQKLRQNMVKFENVMVVEADIREFKLPSEKYKVFSNIPFHLSSEIIQKLIWSENPPVAIYLIVQKQFAKKLIIDRDNFTGQLGASIAPWWATRIRRPLRRNDFFPRPNVDTVLLEIKPRSNILLETQHQLKYRHFVERCYSEQKFFYSLNRNQCDVDVEKKPSELTCLEWIKLFNAFSK